jgi:Subunit CCDC53 of WASH complex
MHNPCWGSFLTFSRFVACRQSDSHNFLSLLLLTTVLPYALAIPINREVQKEAMDIQKQIAMQAVLKAHKRNGTKPPPELLMGGAAPTIKKAPVQTGADPKQSSQAKNAAAAAIAARLGGGSRAPPQTAAGGRGPSDETLDKFRKMVKMGVPPPAIRGKMIAEGISPTMIEEVLSGGVGGGSSSAISRPTATTLSDGVRSAGPKLSSDEERIASQYRKMVKIGLPQGAIIHKMTSDGVPKHVQNSVLAGEDTVVSKPASSSVAGLASRGGPVSTLSPADEQVAAQYRKMLKFGLPEGAIIHKMNGDGVPQHVQKSVLGNESPGASGGDGGAGGTPPPSGGGGPPSRLSSKEEEIAAPYRRMVKMSLPDGAILHKMGMDGIAQNIQDSVIAREVPQVAIATPTSAGGLGIGASTFAAGAASLKKATPQKSKSSPSPSSSSNGKRGSPLAMAAAAAAALRGKGPQKMRNVPQNSAPQKSMSASGPEAMAQAAAAAAARRALRQQDANALQQFESKSTQQKVSSLPQQMVALKPRSPVPTPAPLQARTAPTTSLKTTVSTTSQGTKLAASVPDAPPKAIPRSTTSLQKRASPIASQQVHAVSPAPVKRVPKPTATPAPRKSDQEVRKATPEVRKPTPEVRKPTPEVRKPAPDIQMPSSYILTEKSSGLDVPVAAIISSEVPVSEPIKIAVPTDVPPSALEPVLVIGLDPDEEEVADHYRNLIREYGQSLDTVKEEMINDGAPANIQDAVIAMFVSPQTVGEIVSTADDPVVVLNDEDVDQQINALEEEVAEHYRTLVRGGQSLEEVIQEMIADGAPQQIQDAVTSSFVNLLAPEPCANTTADTSIVSDPETEAHDDVYVLTAPTTSSYRSERDVPQDSGLILLEEPTQYRNKEEPKMMQRKEEPKAVQRNEDPKEQRRDETALKVVPTSTPVAVPNKEGSAHKVVPNSTPVAVPALRVVPKSTPVAVPALRVVPKSTPVAVPNKAAKKPTGRKKTAKGTTILDDGAEQHCACTVM